MSRGSCLRQGRPLAAALQLGGREKVCFWPETKDKSLRGRGRLSLCPAAIGE